MALSDTLKQPIYDLELTVRSTTALKKEEIHTVGSLISYSERELSFVPGLGKKSINDIKRALKERNLFLEGVIINIPYIENSLNDLLDRVNEIKKEILRVNNNV